LAFLFREVADDDPDIIDLDPTLKEASIGSLIIVE
jgi:hypothetical protein